MTLREAKKLGWVVVLEQRPGRLAAEKTLRNQFGHPYTRRVEVGTSDPKGWRTLQAKLVAEIERLEEQQRSLHGAAA